MEPKTKKTIIILIVVAVVGFILWKRYKNSSGKTNSTNSDGSSSDVTASASRLAELIDGAGLNAEETDLVLAFKPTGAYKQWIIQNGKQQGVDYESSLLLNCLWNYYRNADNTAFVSAAAETRYKEIYNKVLAMN